MTHHDIHLALVADSIAAINCNPFINGGRFTAGTFNGHGILSPGPSKILHEASFLLRGLCSRLTIYHLVRPVRFKVEISGDSVIINGNGLWGKGTISEAGYMTMSNNSLGLMRATLIGKNLTIDYLDDTHVQIDSLKPRFRTRSGNGASTVMRS